MVLVRKTTKTGGADDIHPPPPPDLHPPLPSVSPQDERSGSNTTLICLSYSQEYTRREGGREGREGREGRREDREGRREDREGEKTGRERDKETQGGKISPQDRRGQDTMGPGQT